MDYVNGNSSSKTAGKPIICKGAVCRKAGEALVIEDVVVAPPKAWEVRIKILCTSLCHTDVSFWKMDSGPIAVHPRIFGHEAVGIVESVGEYVEEVREGDTVIPVFFRECGECRDCKSTKSNVCTKFAKYSSAMPRDEVGRFTDMKGEPIHHFLYVSSFVEYTVVDITSVVKISPQMPVDKACLLSCGVTTGIGAVWKVARVEEGSTVAIFGLGTVGLAVAQAAKQQGASKIIGIDLNPEKEDIGKKFGVTEFINPKSCEDKKVSQVIKELTDGGADYCFECIGSATVMQDAFESSREGWGRTIILGVDVRGIPLSLDCVEIMRGKSVTGSLFGGIKPKVDIPILIKKYMSEELLLDGFITHEVSFRDINKAFEYLINGQSLRCIIWMDNFMGRQ
ncbi:alcohol dehydrogenase-like 2 [Chenopodium quinoa]|uniref:alcohol dehydrogenase-like 2 n=1 Tax=Chenopodium quinoa TaxID=63459 RepID=UPI000B7950F5|nr:alcohol dehydrogenase-like 2 [Chenopodium quinoa]